MIKRTITMDSENGIHMRPAVALVELSEQFKCDMTIRKGNMKADIRSIMEITMLTVFSGEEITITTEGSDEREAMKALEELFQNDFNEIEVKQ